MFACNRFSVLIGGICRIPALKLPFFIISRGYGCNRKGRLCAITAFFLFLLCRQFRILRYLCAGYPTIGNRIGIRFGEGIGIRIGAVLGDGIRIGIGGVISPSAGCFVVFCGFHIQIIYMRNQIGCQRAFAVAQRNIDGDGFSSCICICISDVILVPIAFRIPAAVYNGKGNLFCADFCPTAIEGDISCQGFAAFVIRLCAGGILIPAVKFIPLLGWYGGGKGDGFAVAQWKGNGGRETVEGNSAPSGMTEPIHWKFTSMEGIQRPYRVKSLPKASYTVS